MPNPTLGVRAHPPWLQAHVVQTCGGCAWRVVGGVLTKSGACEADCTKSYPNTGALDLYHEGIAAIGDDALAGLPLVTHLRLNGNKLRTLPGRCFSGLPRLAWVDLNWNPLLGLAPTAFAGSTALEVLKVEGTGLGCVPAGDIPATAEIRGLDSSGRYVGVPRCPVECAPARKERPKSSKKGETKIQAIMLGLLVAVSDIILFHCWSEMEPSGVSGGGYKIVYQ